MLTEKIDGSALNHPSTTLCLACSASIQPSKSSNVQIHITPCCHRPICIPCTTNNPRLARYNPCIACLGGVGVIASGSSSSQQTNINGGLQDNDVFSIGDDDDGEDEENEKVDLGLHEAETSTEISTDSNDFVAEDPTEGQTQKYYLDRKDTLRGIALRLGINGHELCRLNNLPPSTLSTTPHLLHTRQFLFLPPTAAKLPTRVNKDDEEKRVRERAEKRLQMMTKETDWLVAKAYVALADEAAARDSYEAKQKEMGGGASNQTLEAIAISQYLDDEEWERENA